MNTIDQRILIPTSPDNVWAYISDVARNPEWQTNCRSIAFLTSAKQGQGARWRAQLQGNREYVIEVTTWYDRLGYEYTIIDGSSFAENKGRIRLQEVAEGTVVQWTFSYEVGGILGGLRNALGTRRTIENEIVESLWTLWRQTSSAKRGQRDIHQPKSLMQDAPDVEARAQYKSRHPSVVMSDDTVPTNFTITEPEVAEDDTRPRPAAEPPADDIEPAPTNAQEQSSTKDPGFFDDLDVSDFDFSSTPDETAPVSRVVDEHTEQPAQSQNIEDSSLLTEKETSGKSNEEMPSTSPPTESLNIPAVQTEPSEPLPLPSNAPNTTEQLPAIDQHEESPVPAQTEQTASTKPEHKASVSTAGEVSVFDVFGVPKPSETQEIQAVRIPTEETADAESPSSARDTQQQLSVIVGKKRLVGLRLMLRGKRIKVRLR